MIASPIGNKPPGLFATHLEVDAGENEYPPVMRDQTRRISFMIILSCCSVASKARESFSQPVSCPLLDCKSRSLTQHTIIAGSRL